MRVSTGCFLIGLAFTLALPCIPAPARAVVVVLPNRTAFLAATDATDATGPIPFLGAGHPQTIGSITLALLPPATQLWVGYVPGPGELDPGDWTPINPGHDIAFSEFEAFRVSLSGPVHSFGFDMVEPSGAGDNNGQNGLCDQPECIDSTFAVTLKNGASVVGSFNFNAPNDVLAFVGVWSSQVFDNVEIRETTGGIEDEYWGRFYTGTKPLGSAHIAAPASIELLAPFAAVLLALCTVVSRAAHSECRREE